MNENGSIDIYKVLGDDGIDHCLNPEIVESQAEIRKLIEDYEIDIYCGDFARGYDFVVAKKDKTVLLIKILERPTTYWINKWRIFVQNMKYRDIRYEIYPVYKDSIFRINTKKISDLKELLENKEICNNRKLLVTWINNAIYAENIIIKHRRFSSKPEREKEIRYNQETLKAQSIIGRILSSKHFEPGHDDSENGYDFMTITNQGFLLIESKIGMKLHPESEKEKLENESKIQKKELKRTWEPGPPSLLLSDWIKLIKKNMLFADRYKNEEFKIYKAICVVPSEAKNIWKNPTYDERIEMMSLEDFKKFIEDPGLSLGKPELLDEWKKKVITEIKELSIIVPGKPENKENINLIVDYSKGIIKFNGKPIPIEDTQPFKLLEALLFYGKVHWTIGFVIFDTWANKTKNITVQRFREIISKMNASCEIGIHNKGTGYWRLNPNITINSDICKARALYDDIKKNRPSKESVNKLSEIIQHLFPKCTEIFMLILEYTKTLGVPIENNILEKAANHLRIEEIKYKEGIELAKNMYERQNNKKSVGWNDFPTHLNKMESHLKLIKKSRVTASILLKEVPDRKIGDIELSEIFDDMIVLARLPKEELLNHNSFETLITRESIIRVFEKVITKIKDYFSDKNKEEIIYEAKYVFGIEFINKGIFKRKQYESIDALKKYLFNFISFMIIDRFMISKYGITQEELNDMRKLRSIEKYKNKNVAVEELLMNLPSSWNKERVCKALETKNKLGIHITIDEYWKYYKDVSPLYKDCFE